MASQVKLDDRVLKQLIKQIGGGKAGYNVVAQAGHAAHVEFGTSKMAARPYLRPAFDQVTRNLPKAIGRAIEAGVAPDGIVKQAALDIAAIARRDVPVDKGELRDSIDVEPVK